MSPKLRVGIAALILSFALDQGSKALVAREIAYAERVPVVDGFFWLTHWRNTAASFGLFADGDAAVRLGAFIAASLVGIGLVAWFFSRVAATDRYSALALGLILGGSLGNLADRALRGGVVDFLLFQLPGGYLWPAFNLADSCIVTGVGLMLLALRRGERARRR